MKHNTKNQSKKVKTVFIELVYCFKISEARDARMSLEQLSMGDTCQMKNSSLRLRSARLQSKLADTWTIPFGG